MNNETLKLATDVSEKLKSTNITLQKLDKLNSMQRTYNDNFNFKISITLNGEDKGLNSIPVSNEIIKEIYSLAFKYNFEKLKELESEFKSI